MMAMHMEWLEIMKWKPISIHPTKQIFKNKKKYYNNIKNAYRENKYVSQFKIRSYAGLVSNLIKLTYQSHSNWHCGKVTKKQDQNKKKRFLQVTF